MLVRLGKALGTPNISNQDSVCNRARVLANIYTYGMNSLPDTNHPSKCILVWGRNSLETGSESMINIFPKARKNNAKILVIDPRRTSIAKQATLWIKPKPGSDGYLAIAFIKTIIDENLFDNRFIENWTIGFSKLRQLVDNYSYDFLSKVTWVPPREIKLIARTYATTKPASIQTGNPLDQTANAFHTCRLISILKAITGNLDIPGGDFIYENYSLNNLKDIQDSCTKQMIGSKYKVASKEYITPSQEPLRSAISGTPYPVKASLLFGTNPLITYADTKKTFKALSEMELIVTLEFFKSATAYYSDIILPVAANHEYEDLSPRAGHINVRPKIIEPPDECKSDVQWINLIAKSMNLENQFWSNEEEVYNYVLRPTVKTYSDIVKNGTLWKPQRYYKYKTDGFKTRSGKVEIFSETLQKMRISPIPIIIPQKTDKKNYPFILTSGKDPFSYHSSWRQLPSLIKESNEPFVELNPQTAIKLGLRENSLVIIETKNGSITQRLKYNPGLDPRTVYAAFAWGSPDEQDISWKTANINMLTDWDEPLCEAMGAVTLRGIPCNIISTERVLL
jgi:anaerobic selenocysteine-containing dehydrogenase